MNPIRIVVEADDFDPYLLRLYEVIGPVRFIEQEGPLVGLVDIGANPHSPAIHLYVPYLACYDTAKQAVEQYIAKREN